MVRIISDTSTMYNSTQAREAGFTVAPLSVTINAQTYRELDEINDEQFVAIINEGHMPKSSQPAIGEVLEIYESFSEDEIINISMADGLSGTYSSAVAAAQMYDHAEKITVINSRTLCGPHRRMVETAARLANGGSGKEQILAAMEKMMESAKSFLLPDDFDYLRRGGRLSPLVSFVGKTIRFVPILTQTEDGRQLTMASIKRSDKQAFAYLSKVLADHGVGAGWRIDVTHAAAPDRAQRAKDALAEAFPDAVIEVLPLTPAFITQGGPGCIAVQVIKEL